MGVQGTQIGAQFDILDRNLAARFHELNQRPYIAQGDYNSWMTGYSNLSNFARLYSNVPYVASQWRMEEPRYSNVPRILQAKVKVSEKIIIPTQFTPNPRNYDTTISIGGGAGGSGSGGIGGCGGCGGKEKTSIDTTPIYSDLPPRVYQSATPQSFGDAFRDLFSANEIPSIDMPYPDSKLIDQSGIVTSLITAVAVAGILYVIHRATK